MSSLAFILLYGISYGLVLCLIALGMLITMGLMRVVNLAHGAFAAIGGYLSTSLMVKAGLPFPLAIGIAVFAVAAFGVLVERVIFVFLYTASELDQVLMTIGLNFIAIAGLALAFGPDVVPTHLPPSLSGSVDLGFRSFEVYRLVVTAVCLVVIAALWVVFERTTIGAQLRAAVDNRTMTQAIGVDVPRLFSATFALGCGLAALGGAMGAPMLPLEPLWPFKYLVLIMVIVALCGHGNIRSSLGVAIIVGIVETAGRYWFPQFGGFFIYLLLIALMIWRRDGLFVRPRAT